MHALRSLIHLTLCGLVLGMSARVQAQAAETPVADKPVAEAEPKAQVASDVDSAPKPEPTSSEAQASGESEAPTAEEQTLKAPPNAAEIAAREGRAFIGHMPVSSAQADAVTLRFDVRGHDKAGQVRVYFRPLEAPNEKPEMVLVMRESKGYFARIPKERAPEPGIGYWVIELKSDGIERPVFASADKPHPIHIHVDEDTAREQRLLRLFHGQRSRVTLRGERVALGKFKVKNPPAGKAANDESDSYYHLEAQYAYRFFRTIEELEFALGSLRGDLLDQAEITERREVGLDYGRSAIVFAFGSFVRLRTGVLLGVSTEGFEGGFELGTILGDRDGTQLEFKGGYVSSIGGQFGTRLGWATVPRVPMGASVEITNFPTDEDLGVRMLFDIGYELTQAALVRFIGGYRGRTSLAGGPSLALELHYGF